MKFAIMGVCALFLSAASAGAAGIGDAFSGYFVFGDSLSDTGNIAAKSGGAVPPPPYVDGYFSNGQPFTGIIAEHFDPASVTNYAHGFAEAVNPGPEPLPADLALHLDEQMSLFAADAAGGGAAGSLITMLFGANDIFEALEVVAPTLSPSPSSWVAALSDVKATATEAALAVADAVSTLVTYSPAQIIVLNLPDIGSTPAYAGTILSGLASAATNTFNTVLAENVTGLTGGGTSVELYDLYSLFEAVQAFPSAFGFDPALTGTPCFAVLTAIPDCNGFLFADTVHPTSQAHALLAQEVLNTIPVPGGLPLMAGALGLLAFTRRRPA